MTPFAGYDAAGMSSHAQVNRVLLVRPSALGDVARTVPCLAALKRAFPAASVHWLVNAGFEPVVAAHPGLGGVLTFDRRAMAGAPLRPGPTRRLVRLVGELRAARYDLAIDLQGLFRSAFLTGVSGAARRWGFDDARELGWLFYHHRADAGDTPHTVDRMMTLTDAVIAACDGAGDTPTPPPNAEPASDPDMRLYVPTDAAAWWREARSAQGIDHYAVLAPFTAWPCKEWPLERFVALAKRLRAERPRLAIVVTGAPGDGPTIARAFAGIDRLHAPGGDVGRLMAVLGGASLVVCNDSGPLHLAVGLGRRIVTLFGPTDPARVGPYRRPETVVQPPGLTDADMRHYRRRRDDRSLIARIELETVWRRCAQMLDDQSD